VGQIGSPASLYRQAHLALIEPAMFRSLLAPRDPAGHKGTYGHVLVVAGSEGKTGAARMSGLAALRAGAGLVTVASRAHSLPLAPELMSGSLEGDGLAALAKSKTVIAIGPGLGRDATTESLVHEALEFHGPVVIDADALDDRKYDGSSPRILTPHPGEMGRLTGKPTAEIQKDRLCAARDYATSRGCTVVLKGQRTLLAFADGRVWINPTGTPAMGTGGSGDVLTGLIAGFLAQFPKEPEEAVAAAVYLHGLAGQLGARKLGEKPLIATDILRFLPQAIAAATEECAGLPDAV
jgi:NAD(P)H-hydrate epimerase